MRSMEETEGAMNNELKERETGKEKFCSMKKKEG